MMATKKTMAMKVKIAPLAKAMMLLIKDVQMFRILTLKAAVRNMIIVIVREAMVMIEKIVMTNCIIV